MLIEGETGTGKEALAEAIHEERLVVRDLSLFLTARSSPRICWRRSCLVMQRGFHRCDGGAQGRFRGGGWRYLAD